MATKTCFKCGQEKPLSEFYKHPQMSDGHLNKCKECTKADTRKHEQEKPESVLHSRLSAYSKKPTRTNAYRVVEAALRAGVIEKPHSCSICNCPDTEKRIEAHHYDYERPLEVTWLCPDCHFMADQMRRGREGEKAMPWAKPVVMIDGDKVACRFDSITDAARAVNRSESAIKQCLAGISKTCGGYGWAYEKTA